MREPVIDTRDAGYQQIDPAELRDDDRLVDVTGGEHTIRSIRQLKAHVKVTRDDGWVDWLERGDVVTIVPRVERVELTGEQRQEIVRQVGRMNLLAISGGRVTPTEFGVRLPVGCGYSVEIDLDQGSDTYTVRRVFTRAGTRFVKGEQTFVYCDEIGEIAYQASSFRSYDFPKGAAA